MQPQLLSLPEQPAAKKKVAKRKDTDAPKRTFSFSGHETFVFRYAWLKKAVDAVTVDPNVFNNDDAVVTLGVGKNMVRSIRHWGLATGVLMDHPDGHGLAVSWLGKFLFAEGGKDPYLEDPNTLWLLHWNLCQPDGRATTWHWAMNGLPSNEFTRESLADLVMAQLRHHQAPAVSEAIVKRDVEIFIRTYVPARTTKTTVVEDTLDCPLVELQLIEERGQAKQFQLRRGPKPTLSSYIFLFALLDFWDRHAPERETIAFADIAYKPGSPGTVFKLDEGSILEHLEKIAKITADALSFAETAGIRQVYRRRPVDRAAILAHYYDTESYGI